MKFNLESIVSGIFGIFIVIGSLILLFIKNKKELSFLFNRFDNAHDLENHFIFFEIQSWQDYQIDFRCDNVSCAIRSSIAKKFLHLRFELKEKYYKDLVSYIKKEALTFQYLADQKAKLEEEFLKQAVMIGIPEIVVTKFKHHISQSEIADLYLYERILQYKNFKTDEAKLSAIFCIDLKDMYIAAKDIEEVIMSLNGEIDKSLGIKK